MSGVPEPAGGRGRDEPVDLRAHRQRGSARDPSLAQDPTPGRPGDDAGDAATGDVPLRLAAWLAAVSVEAAEAQSQQAPTPLPAGRATRRTSRMAH